MEKTINYPVAYQDSNIDHMRLMLSDDKEYFSLACTDAKDQRSEIYFQAWRTDNLHRLKLNPLLQANLNAPVHGSIRSIRFVGNSYFVVKEFVDHDLDSEQDKK